MPPHRGLPDELPEPTRHRGQGQDLLGGAHGLGHLAQDELELVVEQVAEARRATGALRREANVRAERIQRGGGLEQVETPERARRGQWGWGEADDERA
jgi:hypothetical protein